MPNPKAPDKILLTEDDVTKVILKNLEKEKSSQKSSEGVTDYPILEFDRHSLQLLYMGVRETLKHSTVKVSGGKGYETAKRVFDVLVSSAALTVLIIPLSAVCLLIYMEDGGNPIFSQVRLTKNGRPFRMYKLRSMCMDAEARFAQVQKENKSDGLAFKSDTDPRITKIGNFIRKTSIDEFPQFWNVLKGDMSLIGPRPPLPREVVLYTPEQMNRLLVKGGLSCICQTEGRSDMEFEKWVESDIRYIKNRSFGMDISLIFRTAAAVIMRKGAK